MICSTCKTSNAEAARFCSGCGAELRAHNTLPSQAPEPEETTRSGRAGQEATLVDRDGDPLLGSTIAGKYRMDAKLGAGGMGAVYRATRLLIGDVVAVKILHSEQRDPTAPERFRREAQAAARLKHPNAVNIYDFGVTDGGLQYLVMELVEGESLRRIIKQQGPVTPSASVEITNQVCAALDEAHRHSIIHRDIKPDNIIVNVTATGLRVKVLDFGIAKLRDDVAGNLTQTGSIVGTPHYMSPEQCLGEELDSRADIYSLGVVLYEMLTGLVPFNSPTSAAVVVQHVTQPPPPLRSLNPSIPPAVERVVLHALEKQRDARPQTAGEFARELSSAENNPLVAGQRAHVPGLGTAAKAGDWTPTTVITRPSLRSSAPIDAAGLPRPPGSNTARVVGVTVLGTLLLLALGFLAAQLIFKHEREVVGSNSNSRVEENRRAKENQTTPTPLPPATSGDAASTAANSPTKTRSQDVRPGDGQIQGGNSFVILGSYPKGAQTKADDRLRFIQGLGYDAHIVDTDNYPNLRGGLWAVVLGPYTRDYAKQVAQNMRRSVPDAYVK